MMTKGGAKKGEPLAFLTTHVESQSADCIPWPYARDETGYGLVAYNGSLTRAHILMCGLAHGAKPFMRAQAAHGCGNRFCVNPKHLRWTDRSGNTQDRWVHGTMCEGEKNAQVKLTAAQVKEIFVDRRPVKEIAAQYGCSGQNITNIQLGRKWRWLTEALGQPRKHYNKAPVSTA